MLVVVAKLSWIEKKAAEAKARQPRKPRSAYHFFAETRRPALLAASASMVEMSKAIAAEWREVSDDERASCEQQAADDRKRYVSECEAAGLDPGRAAMVARGPLPARGDPRTAAKMFAYAGARKTSPYTSFHPDSSCKSSLSCSL